MYLTKDIVNKGLKIPKR